MIRRDPRIVVGWIYVDLDFAYDIPWNIHIGKNGMNSHDIPMVFSW